eukprot:1769424-Pleurochrysis_carterae.AAC.1
MLCLRILYPVGFDSDAGFSMISGCLDFLVEETELGSTLDVELRLPQLWFAFDFLLFCESEGEVVPPWPLGRFSPEFFLGRGEGDLA